MLFFSANLFQQLGTREDFPLTHFGMYKGTAPDTAPFNKYTLTYSYQGSNWDLFALPINRFSAKKDLEKIILQPETFNKARKVLDAKDLNMNMKEEINLYLKIKILPKLKNRKYYNNAGTISLTVKSWSKITQENRQKPDFKFLYYKVKLKDLISN